MRQAQRFGRVQRESIMDASALWRARNRVAGEVGAKSTANRPSCVSRPSPSGRPRRRLPSARPDGCRLPCATFQKLGRIEMFPAKSVDVGLVRLERCHPAVKGRGRLDGVIAWGRRMPTPAERRQGSRSLRRAARERSSGWPHRSPRPVSPYPPQCGRPSSATCRPRFRGSSW